MSYAKNKSSTLFRRSSSTVPLVSVILPVYNAGFWVRECLNSIISQCGVSWECIAVNDGSTDDSGAVLDEYCAKFPSVKVLHTEHRGVIHALNTALMAARGKFITRMDADDVMPVNRLCCMAELLSRTEKHSVVTGTVQYFSSQKLRNGKIVFENNGVGAGFLRYAKWLNECVQKRLFFSQCLVENVIPSPGWMMRREELLSQGGFDARVYPEDYNLTLKLLAGGFSIHSHDAPVVWWRDHPLRASRMDTHYRDQNFFDIKAKYIHSIVRKEIGSRKAVLWGAGKKAKIFFQKCKMNNFFFTDIVTENKKKTGMSFDNILVSPPQILDPLKHFVVCAVSARGAQRTISQFLASKGFREPDDLRWVCR